MQYIKLGPLKIPYRIRTLDGKKEFYICGIKIPFSTEIKDGRKTYSVWGIKFRMSLSGKRVITQSAYNYMEKDQLDEGKIRDICTRIFREKVGYEPDFDNPRSMNEKIFWMKLNYHNPLVTTCCDKYAVKGYVDERLGEGHTIPTLISWDKAEDIDLSKLPERYALKVNWASGYNIIVKDEAPDEAKVKEQVAQWMLPQSNSYYQAFNWGYKNMKPVVYAEAYMEQQEGQLYDYKFFCCNGKAKFWFIATERYGEKRLTHDFYDMDFNHLDFEYGGRAHADQPLEKPRFYEEMVAAAEKLAEPFPFVRVDFYETEDNYYVGEMTFYPGGGILPFTPVEWDYKLGEYISTGRE